MQCDPEGDPWQCAKRGDEDGIKRLLQRSDVNDWINQAGDCIVSGNVKWNIAGISES